jgi:hypothetical protein
MDRILFGDNQFFGINHASEERARAQAMRFQDTSAIIEVLDIAYDQGIRTFMCTTHERIAEVCDHFRANRQRYTGFKFYPCMPYAHKYANAVAERGIFDALRMVLPKDDILGSIRKGGLSVANKDVRGLVELLVDAEMKMFDGLEAPVIFLQNVVTDFLLGLGVEEPFRYFADHIQSRFGAEAGFITMNIPMLLGALERVGIENPIVCANINKIGFRMCGGIAGYEAAIAGGKFRPIAMSVFASGVLDPREAISYVCEQPNIRSIVFGASSAGHIRQTKALIEELSPA